MLAAMAAPAPRIGSPDVVGESQARLGRGRRSAVATESLRALQTTPMPGPASQEPALARRESRLVVGEELLPGFTDRAGIGSELLVHLLDEPRVRAKGRPGGFSCSHRRLSVLVDVAVDGSR